MEAHGDQEYRRKLESVTQELLRSYETLSCLYRSAGQLARQREPRKVARLILEEGLDMTQATRGAFLGPEGAILAGQGLDEVPPGFHERCVVPARPLFRNDPDPQGGLANVLVVPLLGTEEGLGALVLADRKEPFTSVDLKLAMALAAQGAVALENLRRAEEVHEKNRRLERALEEVRATQAELVQSERLATIGGMAGKIVHDLKGPITVLSGYAELLEGAAGQLAPADVGRYARTMREAGGRLQELVTEILEYARGRSVALKPEPWTFPELFDALAACVGPLVLAGKCRLETIRPSSGAVRVDRARIERVVMNLARNALEATRPGGEVRLSGGVGGDEAWIDVGDDGPGVPPELRDRLFDPFVTSGKDEGTGLGLAIAKNLAEAHGGRLTLLDRSPGAHFRIALPLARRDEDSRED